MVDALVVESDTRAPLQRVEASPSNENVPSNHRLGLRLQGLPGISHNANTREEIHEDRLLQRSDVMPRFHAQVLFVLQLDLQFLSVPSQLDVLIVDRGSNVARRRSEAVVDRRVLDFEGWFGNKWCDIEK